MFNNTNGDPGIDHRSYHSYPGYFDGRPTRWDFERIYCQDWHGSGLVGFPSSYPFLSMDSPTVDDLFYHIDNNSGAHLVELPIVEGVASALSHSFF